MRVCSKCFIEKPLSHFYFDKYNQCYRRDCSTCITKYKTKLNYTKQCDAKGEIIAIKYIDGLFFVLGPFKPTASFSTYQAAEKFVLENWTNFILKVTDQDDRTLIYRRRTDEKNPDGLRSLQE